MEGGVWSGVRWWLHHMNDVEVTEEWLFERQRVTEENKLRDPDDVYISVRQREAERIGLGLPPRIQFLDKSPSGESTRSEEGQSEVD